MELEALKSSQASKLGGGSAESCEAEAAQEAAQESSQAKSSQAKPSQAKSSQVKSSQVKSSPVKVQGWEVEAEVEALVEATARLAACTDVSIATGGAAPARAPACAAHGR